MIKVVTHSGSFHADDVFAVALIELSVGEEAYEVIRTRDENLIKTGDYVVDVGRVYDPQAYRFDHHQNGAPERENGIPYAAFGLVWKELGSEVCGSKEVADEVERKLVIPIDAYDVGVSLATSTIEGFQQYAVFDIVSSLLPAWGSDESFDEQFQKAVKVAKMILERAIAHAKGGLAMKELVAEVYEKSDDKRVLEFDRYVSSGKAIDYPEVLITVHPDSAAEQERWIASTVRMSHDTFEPRIKFPEEWAGLSDEELQQISGISDAVFCHKNRFLFVAKSKESVYEAIFKIVK